MPHEENVPQHACCGGQCGKVEHFSSRSKLFKHLRECHGVGGFQRRGRESRKRRQEARAIRHTAENATQPRPASGPHRQWVRVSTAGANKSPATGVNSPAKAPSSVRAEGPCHAALQRSTVDPPSRAHAVHAPPFDCSSRATEPGWALPTLPTARSAGTTVSPASSGWDLSPLPTAQSATASGSALRWREQQRQPLASANDLPTRSCLVSPGIGANSPAEAPCSLVRAPSSPAEAPTAAGEPPLQGKRQQPLRRIPGAKRIRYR